MLCPSPRRMEGRATPSGLSRSATTPGAGAPLHSRYRYLQLGSCATGHRVVHPFTARSRGQLTRRTCQRRTEGVAPRAESAMDYHEPRGAPRGTPLLMGPPRADAQPGVPAPIRLTRRAAGPKRPTAPPGVPGSAITAGARCCSVEDARLETIGRILVKFFQTAESTDAPGRRIYLSLGGAHTDDWGSPGLWLASRTTPRRVASRGGGRGVGPGPCAFLTNTRGGSLSGVTNPMLTG